jgi:hypothetical protein
MAKAAKLSAAGMSLFYLHPKMTGASIAPIKGGNPKLRLLPHKQLRIILARFLGC